MPPLRGSKPISRLRNWVWRPRRSHNSASLFTSETCIEQRRLRLGKNLCGNVYDLLCTVLFGVLRSNWLPTIAGLLLICCWTANFVYADDWVFAQRAADGGHSTKRVSGRLVAESDSTLLIQSADQRLWRFARSDTLERAKNSNVETPLDREQLAALLRDAFPNQTLVHTDHYLIFHDVEPDQARQAERLLEHVYNAYFDFCGELKLPVAEPNYPLVVLLFRDPQRFTDHLESELGANAATVVAFYSLSSNQVAVRIDPVGAVRGAHYLVSQNIPLDSRTTLATHLVHEATHQLMCNSGLQQRMAEYPLWVSEGLAAYFEPADPFSRNGWRRPGGMNTIRLSQLSSMLRDTGRTDIAWTIASDEQFRQTSSASESYSLAWGLTYFLLKRHRSEYAEYLRKLSQSSRLIPNPSDQRLKDFESCFRADITQISQQLAEYIAGL